MTRDGGGGLRALLISGAAFAAGFILCGAAWWALVLGSRAPAGASKPGLVQGAIMAAWLTGIPAAVSAVAFAAVTALFRHWRQLPSRRLTLVSALLGAVAITLNWTGLTFFAVRPMRLVLGTAAAVWLWYALPGLIAAALALILTGWRRARA